MGSDAGMSLTELIIYIGIAVLVTLGVSSMFISGIGANTATSNRDAATGQAQLISTTLQVGVRHASDVTVTGDLLRARVATGDSGWQCEAWAITPGGQFVHRTSTSAIAVPSDYADWAVLAKDARGTLSGGRVFAVSTNRVEAALTITVGEVSVPITTDAVAQARGEGSPASCW